MADLAGKTPNPWNPEQDPIRLKVLGKLTEELAEGAAAAARCMIQGIDESEPVTGKPNRTWLTEEVADILANVEIVIEHFALDAEAIALRASTKHEFLTTWLGMMTRPGPDLSRLIPDRSTLRHNDGRTGTFVRVEADGRLCVRAPKSRGVWIFGAADCQIVEDAGGSAEGQA